MTETSNQKNNANGDAEKKDDEWKSPLRGETLDVFKKYLMISLGGFVVAFVIAWAFRNELTTIIKWPLIQAFPEKGADTIFLRVIDAFMMHVKICFYFSLLLVLPFLSFNFVNKSYARFLPADKNSGFRTGIFMIALFYLGVSFAYLVAMPAAFDFLVQYSMDDAGVLFDGTAMELTDSLQVSMREHIDLTMKMLIAFGVGFEAPLAMLVSVRLGISTPEKFARYRGVAVVVIAMFSSLLTPPDPWTMLLLLGPMYALYELGILLCKNKTDKSESK